MRSTAADPPARENKLAYGYGFAAPERYRINAGVWTPIRTGVSLQGDELVRVKVARMGYVIADEWFMMVLPEQSLAREYGLRFVGQPVYGKGDTDEIVLTATADRDMNIVEGKRFAVGVFMPFGVLDKEPPFWHRPRGRPLGWSPKNREYIEEE